MDFTKPLLWVFKVSLDMAELRKEPGPQVLGSDMGIAPSRAPGSKEQKKMGRQCWHCEYTFTFPHPWQEQEDESHQAALGASSEGNLSLHKADLNEKLISACWKRNGKRQNNYFKMNLVLASSIQISVVFFQSELFRSLDTVGKRSA